MSLYFGLKIAALAIAVSVYVGFTIRLYTDKKFKPIFIIISLYLFSLFLFAHFLTPFFAVMIAIFDKDIRGRGRGEFLRRLIVILLSPIIGLKYVFTKLPVNYNLLVEQLPSVIKDIVSGFEYTINKNEKSMNLHWVVTDFVKFRMENILKTH